MTRANLLNEYWSNCLAAESIRWTAVYSCVYPCVALCVQCVQYSLVLKLRVLPTYSYDDACPVTHRSLTSLPALYQRKIHTLRLLMLPSMLLPALRLPRTAPKRSGRPLSPSSVARPASAASPCASSRTACPSHNSNKSPRQS